jgi:NTE family protein
MKGDDQAKGPARPAAVATTDLGSSRRVAIVAAGAGARGAFEAGALSVLVPWLAERGMRPTVFVGTSAGAINAALLAAGAHLEPTAAASALLEFWRGLSVRKVYRSPLISAPGTLATYLGQLIGRSHVVSLLDTSPMLTFAEQVFEPLEPALRENIRSGQVEALALVATDRAQRTTVFTDHAPHVAVPHANPGRAIDYRATEVTFKHVLASSAIPVLFRPVEIDGAYYTDGGVRLNTPIAPAAALGATHVAVVATHPETYPAAPPPQPQSRPPDAVDSMVAVLESVLADRMVEDLHTLDKLNRAADGKRVRLIPRLFVGPSARDEIGELAARAYENRHRGRRAAAELDFRALRSLIGAREKGSGDLLSYVYFDPAFAEDAIQLGIRRARAKIQGGDPWQPRLTRGGRARKPKDI